jgi:manganese transport protein
MPVKPPSLIARMRAYRLPATATAPFCPSEISGTVCVPAGASGFTRFRAVAGAGLLVAVGYMDPGNWATDIAAGSHFGYALLWVVVLAGLAAILLQDLAARVGIAADADLAQLCRREFSPRTATGLWLLAEAGIIACDLAEVLGTALALQLLFHLPLTWGVLGTALDTVLVLALQGAGFRRLEAIVGGLVATIAICCGTQVLLAGPDWGAAAAGLVPGQALADPQAWWIAIGIIGATIMPHNLYLHSAIVRTRAHDRAPAALAGAMKLLRIDTVLALALATLVNGGLLMLAAAAFHAHGERGVEDIADAHRLLEPLLGPAGGILFAIALLAAGQSSTLTGTIAGQVVLDGFVGKRIPCWKRRLITRVLAIVPAFIGVSVLGERGIGTLLVASQVALSLQLPFALAPLLRFAGQPRLMGALAAGRWTLIAGWAVFAAIVAANGWVMIGLLRS